MQAAKESLRIVQKRLTKTDGPKPNAVDLDELMSKYGSNWHGNVAAGALVSTARDLHLQEGENGMARSIMHYT